ncbi:MAG: hypothetical protein H0T07_01865 [Actinobacteria bacterium]|nr:hypothetical protein [Actinomycetota bacterium]
MTTSPTVAPRDTAPTPWGRRAAVILVAAGLAGAPAAVLRSVCAGRSCDNPAQATSSDVPFCSLPDGVRSGIADGFMQGRSPDILAVTGKYAVEGVSGIGASARAGAPGAPWPSRAGSDDTVPLVLSGTGVSGGDIPAGTTLDSVAPTLAGIAGIRRPHPEVRSGEAIAGVRSGGALAETAGRERPRLILEVVWKGVGSRALEESDEPTPVLDGLMASGAGTMDARTGSLPLDPAATLTTLGTGGLPRQHGITGTVLRNEAGKPAIAWGPGAPLSVIAGLGDDLDRSLGGRPKVGLVATEPSDRGAIGGTWYPGPDEDTVVVPPARAPGAAARAATKMIAGGFGSDGVVDLAVVVMTGPISRLDRALGHVVAAADEVAEGRVTTVVTATGGAPGGSPVAAARVRSALERAIGAPEAVVAAAAPGGVFLDQSAVARQGITDESVVTALRKLEIGRRRLFGDAFPAIAVSFSRYC